MASKAEIDKICWQCSEFCIYFAEILNDIDELCEEKDKGQVTKEDIVKKIQNKADWYANDRSSKLEEILEYACDLTYVLKDDEYYKVNNHVDSITCSSCGEEIYPFISKDFKVGKNYLDQSTFEVLANDFAHFKKQVLGEFSRLSGGKDCSEKLLELEEKNKELERDIISKEKLINFLLDNYTNNADNMGDEKCKQTNFDFQSHNSKDDFSHIINSEFVTSHRKSKNAKNAKSVTSKDIPLQNRFNGLFNNESDCKDDDSNEEIEFNDWNSTSPIRKNLSGNRKPFNVINKFPDNDVLYIPQRSKKHVPGASNYANITKHGRKVCIIGDSIIQRIKVRDINDNLNNATAFKKVFPGGTAEEIEYYTNKILEKQDIDKVILNIGSNNVHSKHLSINTEIEIVNTILKTVAVCHRNGVNDVYVSGITSRRDHQEKIDKINGYLRNGTKGMSYIFIDNGNIKSDKHLWDGLHLNKDGFKILERNFLGALNSDFSH